MSRTRDRIAALEAIPTLPPDRFGQMRWARRDGTVGSYIGPVRDLGEGIPRPRSTRPLIYRMQRALWHLAFGYVSGFPILDVVAFTVRGFWGIDTPMGAPAVVVELTDAELTPSAPMTEADYLDLCRFAASDAALDAGIVEPVRPHWLIPIEPDEES